MKYKMILFDLDGTILNTLADLKNAVNYGLRKNGLPERSFEEVKSFVGNGIKNLCIKASNNIKVDNVYNDFKEYYSLHLCDETSIYPNISTLLLELKKKHMLGILSNKKDSAVQRLSKYYFKDIFDIALGETSGLERKPSSDMLEYILKKYNLDRKEVLYIGDSDVDITFSNNCSIDYIIVDYGFRTHGELEKLNPRVIISNPLEVLKYLGD
jgi:phosphoglycolate phosphatase